MKLISEDDATQVADFAARYEPRTISEATDKGKYFVLGLPTGSTPLGMYKKLIEFDKAGVISFEMVKTFNMDEYVGKGTMKS
ncbi:hypothetical protein CRE_25444 [Caenorhabditis remanei]|uniref:Glucosamine-6-phosphate deaminase n=1 Tax=Caenorhabditis remanei TaxID=31234 RepID=E3LT76_CAERE|nr:hypothetical protein CRE_25444 [Caenorhabditis remanei]